MIGKFSRTNTRPDIPVIRILCQLNIGIII